MSRKPIIAGNWKMNLLQADAKALFEGIKSFTKDFTAQQLPRVVILDNIMDKTELENKLRTEFEK